MTAPRWVCDICVFPLLAVEEELPNEKRPRMRSWTFLDGWSQDLRSGVEHSSVRPHIATARVPLLGELLGELLRMDGEPEPISRR